MAKKTSRPEQWAAAVNRAKVALAVIETQKEELDAAVQDLVDLQGEYQEWLERLTPGGSEATREKLEAVIGLNLDGTTVEVDEAQGVVDEAEALDLPRGFGND